MKATYQSQVELLLRCLPAIYAEDCFALKGGTAINLFYAEMPRLSVDIDLTYTKVNERDLALNEIADALMRIVKNIESKIPSAKAQRIGHAPRKLLVSKGPCTIKVEPNTILRGLLLPSRDLKITKVVSEKFGLNAVSRIVAKEELYAGKFCAALDRQHPRDLFDVMEFFKFNTITELLLDCFTVFLASHNRPMSELLSPSFVCKRETFENEFVGMTTENVDFSDLKKAFERLVANIANDLSENQRKFLISIHSLNPQWELLPFSNAAQLPALQWKLQNLKNMSTKKHKSELDLLGKALL